MPEEKKVDEKDSEEVEEVKEKQVDSEITEEMQKAYIDYAMSVIVSRALPAAEDGLKPVHRRILYAMNAMGLDSSKQTRKTARIVGEVLGKFHPHGDMAVYDSLVRMAQDFSLRYPLIQGQGNFGSIDGDPPAAMRYTEAKLDKIADELLDDIEKNTVEFIPNFDNSLKEPVLLPARLPNLLLNGASGIAVGMTTNIPPHNIINVCEAINAYIDDPKIEIDKLIRIVEAPDFPTGGYVVSDNLSEMYKNGKASLGVRGRLTTEEHKGKESIIITEIPYQINKTTLIEQIAKLVQERKLPDVSDLRDESAKGKIRIVIELRKGADSKFTINRLYQYTDLQTRFDAILLALVNGEPRVLNLKQIVEVYVDYRAEVLRRRTKFELEQAEARKHIVEGLLIALKELEAVIETIKKSKNATEASEALVKKYSLSTKQAQAILETRLQQLTALEQSKLRDENKSLEERIKELNKILADKKEIFAIIKKDLSDLKRKYGDSRRTTILQRIAEIQEKDLIAKKDVIVTITDKGYVKRIGEKEYHEQKRGGKGVMGADLSTGDFVKQLIICNTHDYLLYFTDKGRVYWLKAYEIPETGRYGKGKALVNLLNLKEERVTSVIPVSKFENYLMMVTKKGQVKKLPLQALSKPRKIGVRAINLPQDNSDLLIDVQKINEKQEVLLVTARGQAARFSAEEVRAMGRASYGVTGVKLDKDDYVVSLEVLPESEEERKKTSVLTVTTTGFGKRSPIDEYRKTSRACKGVININLESDKRAMGSVVTTVSVRDDDSIIVTTAKGMVIRTKVKDIRVMGRATQGVRIIKLQQGDSVTDLVKANKLAEE
jgi:DNA gyrase subunit A